ncbi:HIF1A family protein [Megaselia abdita]
MDNKKQSSSAGGTTTTKPKEKRRSNEKRKEKSRDAARCRRSRETEIFNELGEVLPLNKEDVDQLDKASVMRLAIALLKARNMLEMFPHIKSATEKEEVTEDTPPASPDSDKENNKPFNFGDDKEACNVLMESLDGFLMILANDGDITYVSENIKEYLGITKIDVLGNQIWDYCHQCDHDELKEALNLKKSKPTTQIKEEVEESEELKTTHRDMFIRLKCTLTSRGRSVNIKSASYKVIHVTGHLVINTESDKRVLIAVARPIPHPSNIEIPLGTTTFLTKHSLDMKFTYVDDKMLSLFGYKPDDLMGQSIYDCHHGGDSNSLHSTFKIVLNKGQGETCRYRFLGKSGGYCWIVTQATVVYDKQKPQSVVCVNYVISNLEKSNEIYSLAQYEASSSEKQDSETILVVENTENKPTINHKKSCEILKRELAGTAAPSPSPTPPSSPPSLAQCNISENKPKSVTASVFRSTASPNQPVAVSKPQSVTASVFTPISQISKEQQAELRSRVEGMNKGYLRAFSTDIISDLTMLKEEPDDITAHLTASTGPTCIPLDDDDSSPLFDLNFMDSHNLILSEDINSLDSNNSQNSNKYYPDPFINYRDESNDTSSSQHLLSPGAVSKSPDAASSLPSLCSPNSLSQDELAFMTSDENIDLSMRAPYISMDEQDDLPLLTADGNVMWNQYNENIPIIHHPEMKDGIIQINNNQQAVTTTTTPSSVALTTSTTNSSNQTNNDVNSLIENIMQLQNNHMVHTQQHQQHPQSPQGPQLLSGMPTHQGNNDIENIENIIINGGKFDSVPNLCDSMEAFENYHKDYSWRDFLQINPSDLQTQDDKQLQIPQQSIILNTAAVNPNTTTTTIHVPLITIQNNGNNNHHKNLTTANLCNNTGEFKLTSTPQKLTAAMIRISNNNANTPTRNLLLTTTTSSPQNNHISNKRHIITNRTPSMVEPKRIKNNSVEIQTSTQLLQQLMAPTQKQKTKVEWNQRNGNGLQQHQLPSNNSSTNSSASSSPAPSSNSVLKNLLVSGCDLPFSPQEPTSTTSSPVVNYLNEDVFLVSPDSTFDGPDDMPPALIDNECGSDSGIDEANVLSRSGSALNIAINDYQLLDHQKDEKKTFRKRRHSALMVDEAKEKVMKNRGAEGPQTPPNVGSPFLSDAFLMEYSLAGEDYLNSDIEKFLD